MQQLKITSWNIEHANKLLDYDDSIEAGNAESLDAIAKEIDWIDAVIIMVAEAPKGEARASALFDRAAPGYDLVVRGSDDWRDYGIRGSQWMWFLVRKNAPITGRLLHLDQWNELTAPAWAEQRRGNRWEVS